MGLQYKPAFPSSHQNTKAEKTPALSLFISHLSPTLVQLSFSFDRVEKTLIQTLACQLSSTLMQLLFSFDQDMRVEKTLIQTLACQLSSTLMQLLFSFDQDMRVEKTLIQTLACQLLSTLMQLLFSFDLDVNEFRKVSYKLSLVNSYQVSFDSHLRLTKSFCSIFM